MTPTQTAQAILDEARRLGFQVLPGHTLDVLTVETTFTPNDSDAYLKAESDASQLLRMIRMVRPGTVWGTDSASVGGHAGLTGGYVRMNKSGVELRVLNALRKLVA